jgi:hypothetical protein
VSFFAISSLNSGKAVSFDRHLNVRSDAFGTWAQFVIAFSPASLMFIQITGFSRSSRGIYVSRIVASPSITSPARADSDGFHA